MSLRRHGSGRGRSLKAAMSDRTLIAIVDDDQLFRESLRKLVMLLGYTVQEFPSAGDFLASHLLPETACLVTDVHMPGLSGVELHGCLIKLGYAYPDEVVRD